MTAQALFRQTITHFGKYQQIHARHEWKLVKHALHGTLYYICWYGLFFLKTARQRRFKTTGRSAVGPLMEFSIHDQQFADANVQLVADLKS